MNEEKQRDYDAEIEVAETKASYLVSEAERKRLKGRSHTAADSDDQARRYRERAKDLRRRRDLERAEDLECRAQKLRAQHRTAEADDEEFADNQLASLGVDDIHTTESDADAVRRWIEQTMLQPEPEDEDDDTVEPEFVIEDEDGDVEFEFRNTSDRSFEYIGNEDHREYRFPEGDVMRVTNPVLLHVSHSGHHYIVTEDEAVHVIPPTWRSCSWRVEDGTAQMRF